MRGAANGRAADRRPRVAIATLGCKVNQSETQEIVEQLGADGYEVADFSLPADLYIINTCTVTHLADRKSRQLIHQARRANPGARICVTGCYAAVAGETLRRQEPVDLVVDLQDRERVSELARLLVPPSPSPAPQSPPAGRTRALVKIQDGCNVGCSFCIVPRARGAPRARPAAAVLANVRHQLEQGYRELVLTGVHMGLYRAETAEGPIDLPGLLAATLALLGPRQRLRISSILPIAFDFAMLDLWADERLCPHFHLPLQSGSDATLRRMARPYTTDYFRRLVQEVRARVPGVAITTDLIVGFPGETETEFDETCRFLEEIQFSRVHVFPFSPRAETPAAGMPHQVPDPVRKERGQRARAIAARHQQAFTASLVGSTRPVLWERRLGPAAEQRWHGLTDNYVRAVARSGRALANTITPAELVGLEGEVLLAEVDGE